MKKEKITAQISKKKPATIKTFHISKKTELVIAQALRDYANGKTYVIHHVDTFLKEL